MKKQKLVDIMNSKTYAYHYTSEQKVRLDKLIKETFAT